jgi:hypothetical protein
MNNIGVCENRADIIFYIKENKKVSEDEIIKKFYNSKNVSSKLMGLELNMMISKSKKCRKLEKQNYYIDKVEGNFIYYEDK